MQNPSLLSAFNSPAPAAASREAEVPARLCEDHREHVFAPYRERILYPVAALGTLVLLPLGVHHLVRGRHTIAGLLLLLVAMLGIDAIAMYRRKRPPIPFALLLLPGAASVILSLTTHLMYGLMWSYPLALFSFFVLPRRIANAASLSLVGMAASVTYLHDGVGTTLRFALSLAFCILVVNIILNIVEAMHGKLLALSLVDPLTGAFNRRHMDRRLGEVRERFLRSGAPAAMLIVDIDHFKSVNDRFGHQAGDQVLRRVVDVVRERSRRLDELFRIGGEEFMLVLPDTRLPEAMIVAEHLRAAIARAAIAPVPSVTVSIGVADLLAGDEVDRWMRRADAALYRAKDGGRNRAVAATA